MNILHEKSPCCQGKIWRFGQRRRQCIICRRTWSVWKRKRGRKCSRPDKSLLQKIFVERQRLDQIAAVRLNRKDLSTISKRLYLSASRLLRDAPPQRFTANQYILVIDALWFKFGGERWTMYLRAVRSVKGIKATFLPPLLLKGRENPRAWRLMINLIPDHLKGRIIGLVSDSWRGVGGVAQNNKWILQRCHFHLLSQLQINRGRWKQFKDQTLREEIYQTVRKLLVTRTKLSYYQKRLVILISRPDCPKRLRAIARECLRRLNEFRTYLQYSELNFPTTTNSMESMNNLIRKRCRTLRTPQSLIIWTTVLLLLRPEITCNGHDYQQN